MTVIRVVFKIVSYALAIVCVANLLLLVVCLVKEGRVVQYRMNERSVFAAEWYYDAIEFLQSAVTLLLIAWLPIALARLLITTTKIWPLPLVSWTGMIACLTAIVILAADPFGAWFYYWD